MKSGELLQIKTLAQYYALAGLGKPRHPLISVYRFKDMPQVEIAEKARFTLGFYVVTIKHNCTCKSQYGQTVYDFDEGVMGFTAPNQVMGVEKGFVLPQEGWCLMFHPDFLLQYELGRKIKDYHFFGYEVNESLILSEEEEKDIDALFDKIKQEIYRPVDRFSQDVLVAQLDLLLTYSNRFYNRQFITRRPLNDQLLMKFNTLLNDYFSAANVSEGLPAVSWFAGKLNLSPKYLSDVLKQLTGLTTQQHIHEKLIEKAKEKLSATGLTVQEIAFELGFEHAASFSKFFKARMQQSPLQFRASFN